LHCQSVFMGKKSLSEVWNVCKRRKIS
jgi:hypothetical protein